MVKKKSLALWFCVLAFFNLNGCSTSIPIPTPGHQTLHLPTPHSPSPSPIQDLQEPESVDLSNSKIGVLLPLKGKFSKWGQKSLQGIQLALASCSSVKIELILEENADDLEDTLKSLEHLSVKHEVLAVLGPLLSKGIESISKKAQELEVPLISLSRKTLLPQDYILQAGLTQKIQAEAMAHYAMEKLKAKKFAIIYPNEKFGAESASFFWDSVEAMGGRIVGIESYPPEETDFIKIVNKLSGLEYPEARQRELDMLLQERNKNNIKKRSRKTEHFFALKPIVDYDAVFIPDDAKIAGQILPTFAYRDIENVKFLGTSSWNSPEFLLRTQGYNKDVFFLDAFFLESQTQESIQFINYFKHTFQQDPTSIEVVAYDAAAFLCSALSGLNLKPKSVTQSRKVLKDFFKKSHQFNGAIGKITLKDSSFSRKLNILTVKNGNIIEN